jgi:hypothetical protein
VAGGKAGQDNQQENSLKGRHARLRVEKLIPNA